VRPQYVSLTRWQHSHGRSLTSDHPRWIAYSWAYGILIYEVMSRGLQPYADFRTLAEVAEQVKAGYTLPCPQSCRPEVHTRAMLPCWTADPSARLGFSGICHELGALGASRVDKSHQHGVGKNRVYTEETKSAGAWTADFKTRSLLGPSVHHIETLATTVVTAVENCNQTGGVRGRLVDPPESATIGHGVATVIKSAGADDICPRDGQQGCAYVDILTSQDDVGKATALLSYTWSYRILSVANALRRWTEQGGRNSKRTYIWICSLCLNQHRLGAVDMSPAQLSAEFGSRVLSIGRILPMLEPW
jgi:hypothetical protein